MRGILMKQLIILTIFLTQIAYAENIKLLTQKGAKIAAIMCDQEKLQIQQFQNIKDAKRVIIQKKLCTNLSDKQLLAVATYLTSNSQEETTPKTITVPKEAKCPICGMFVYKYPKWVAFMEDEAHKKFYFDGVKDMMKYYFNNPKKHYHTILVTDFYTLKPLIAKEAFFVIGSNVYGPMGEELIPFVSKEDAQIFLQEHKGTKILTFDEILETYLY